MSLEVTFWSVIITGALVLIVSLAGAIWMIHNGFQFGEEGVILGTMIVLGLFVGYILVAPFIPSVVAATKGEYVETDAIVVDCVLRNPYKYKDRYKKLVIYIPETNGYYEIAIVGSNKTSVGIEVGKTFRVKYYPLLLERQNSRDRFVEFLYCVDDMNE